jgi:hypothetical protein
VIVGTVVENVGGQLYDFRLRIDHVLRGSAKVGEVRRFEFLYPGWPLADVGDGTKMAPCEPIPCWNGNVIALSLDALAPDGKTRYNAASWISGDLPINHDLPRTTLAEMTSIAAMPQTDSAPSPTPTGSRNLSPVAALVAVAVAVLSVVGLDARRRRSASPALSRR